MRNSLREYPGALLQALRAHAERAAPLEACGVVSRAPNGALSPTPGRNLRGSSTAFLLDPETLVGIRRRGHEVHALYHSHCDVSAAWSVEDQWNARLWPDVDHLVVGVEDGRATDVCCYRHDGVLNWRR